MPRKFELELQLTEPLQVELTKEELLERGQQLAEAMQAQEVLEMDRKIVNDEYKGKIGVVEAEIHNLSKVIRTKKETRDVPIREEFDFNRGIVERFRLDTNKRIGQRAILPGERQTEITKDEGEDSNLITLPEANA